MQECYDNGQHCWMGPQSFLCCRGACDDKVALRDLFEKLGVCMCVLADKRRAKVMGLHPLLTGLVYIIY